MNPLDFTGPHFLLFYAGIIVLACLLMVFVHRAVRGLGGGVHAGELNVYELAFLADSGTRAVQSAAVALANQGLLLPGPGGTLVANPTTPNPDNTLESVVLNAARPQPASFDKLLRAAQPALLSLEDRLIGGGYLVSPGSRSSARLVCVAVTVAVLGLGIAKVVVGTNRNKPVGFLLLALAFALLLLTSFVRRVPRLSSRGQAAVDGVRRLHDSTVRRPQAARSPNDLLFAVALLGPAALAGTALADFSTPLHLPRHLGGSVGTGSSGSSCSTSSCSSSDGGSSCSSGCGGCGGGGD
jgi:uncharacterized protein (TIGR04222 family)